MDDTAVAGLGVNRVRGEERLLGRGRVLALGALLLALLAASALAAPRARATSFGGLGALGSTVKFGLGEGEGELDGDSYVSFAADPTTGDFFTASRYVKNERYFAHLQEFGPHGEFLADATLPLTPEVKLEHEPKEEERGERITIAGLAVDPGASGGERVYLLLARARPEDEEYAEEKYFEVRNPEAEAVAALWEFSTTSSKGKLTGEQLVVDENAFNAMGAEKAGESNRPLLFPRGLAVDPKTHDVIITARQNESTSTEGVEDEETEEEEFERTVVQRVHPEGKKLGPRYVDSEDCLDGHEVPSEPDCAEDNDEFGSSPVVSPGGRVLLQDYGELWELPASASASEGFKEFSVVPKLLFALSEVEEAPIPLIAGAESLANGGSLSLIPSSSSEATIFMAANYQGGENPAKAITSLALKETGSSVSIHEIGWTAGQAKGSAQTKCVLPEDVGLMPIAGTREGGVLVLELGEGSASADAFGTGGEACGSKPQVTKPAAAFGGSSSVTSVPEGEPVRLSSSVTGAYATSELWRFKYKEAGGSSGEEAPVQTPYKLQGTTRLEHTFAHAGEYEVIETVNTDDLGYQQVEAQEVLKLMVLAVPTVSTGAASSLKQASAQLNATVNPNGSEVTSCVFEYGTSEGSYPSQVPCKALPGNGESAVPVSAELTGLQPHTTYHYRITATNGVGKGKGNDQAFTTLPEPPVVSTGAASSITASSAQLNATVNPNGGEVTACTFEYGTSPSYGSTAPCTASPPTGTSAVAVSAQLSGLQAGTTYHYRISATNGSGAPSKGADQSFTTQAKESSSGSSGGGSGSSSTGSGTSTGTSSQGTLPFSESVVAPTLTDLAQTHSSWRAAGGAASRSHKKQPPIGTVFSFVLNDSARVSLTFDQKTAGRKSAGKCVAQTSHNAHKPRCALTVARGRITVSGQAGANTVAFQGRINGHTLPAGGYTVTVSAEGAGGHSSSPKTLSFAIVA